MQAKGAFDEAIVLSTNEQERNTSAVQAAMSEVKRLLEEKLTEVSHPLLPTLLSFGGLISEPYSFCSSPPAALRKLSR